MWIVMAEIFMDFWIFFPKRNYVNIHPKTNIESKITDISTLWL